ncbi:serine/threonine protein kinase [Candidatus Micrarchaeota archaeon]|nr:serine/threonine protein kinase [Candidatus Micrarchaeota archaeon]
MRSFHAFVPRSVCEVPRTNRSSSTRYLLHDRLGSGNSAEVYAASDLDNPSAPRVALKILRDDRLHNPAALRHVYVEYFTLSHLPQHPHMSNLLDHGFFDKLPFLVTDAIDFILPGAIKDKKLPHEDLRSVVRQVLDTLVHIHSHGILHRDIKPSNVLLTRRGGQLTAVVIDFGFATFIADGSGPNNVSGSVSYMPPEAFAPSFHLSPGFDIFSFGFTVREWVYHHRFFDQKAFETDLKLSNAVTRAIETDIRLRFQSAPQMIDAIS